jgi:hypothetical protein
MTNPDSYISEEYQEREVMLTNIETAITRLHQVNAGFHRLRRLGYDTEPAHGPYSDIMSYTKLAARAGEDSQVKPYEVEGALINATMATARIRTSLDPEAVTTDIPDIWGGEKDDCLSFRLDTLDRALACALDHAQRWVSVTADD